MVALVPQPSAYHPGQSIPSIFPPHQAVGRANSTRFGKDLAWSLQERKEMLRKISSNLMNVLRAYLPSRKVQFVIAGAQKGGTTALYCFLSEHPNICLASPKETNFFSLPNKQNINWYHMLFSPTREQTVVGEASPMYMLLHENSAPAMARYNRRMKVIFILRNPIERAYSQYKMNRARGQTNLDFMQYLEVSLHRPPEQEFEIDPEGFLVNPASACLAFGKYCRQIKTFLDFFPKEQLLSIRTEDLSAKHAATMQNVYSFLGVPHHETVSRVVHSYPGDRVPDDARVLLADYYRQEILDLEELLDWNLSSWKERDTEKICISQSR